MSPAILALLLVLLGSLCSSLHLLRATISRRFKNQKNDQKLPPGPQGLPIIGNLHILGKLPHKTLSCLAKKYGPIMSLRLGSAQTIVVSSPEAVELFFKTHDAVFASRPRIQAIEHMAYNTKGMIFAKYGSYWRDVKKLCIAELLSASQIEFFGPLRKAELMSLIESLKKAAATGETVDISEMVKQLIENTMSKMILGRTKDDKFNLKKIVQEVLLLTGAFNLADYIPWLGVLDLQGLKRRFKAMGKALDEVLDKIIEEHEHGQQKQEQRDFVDVLLSLSNQQVKFQNDGQECTIDRTRVKAILLDMIGSSFDTSATTIEWALAELQRQPHVKLRLQKELETVVGRDRMVEETDLAKLPYLDLVVKETFRLHPAVPLLLPHESLEEVTINGYNIPKKSRILVNVWSIGRDSDTWSANAEEFLPERFAGSNTDVRGYDFKVIPFGSGRRRCPGIQLAIVTIKFVLAQLMHCFDWELPNHMLPNEVDMTEEFGLTLPRANHLFAKPTYRLQD